MVDVPEQFCLARARCGNEHLPTKLLAALPQGHVETQLRRSHSECQSGRTAADDEWSCVRCRNNGRAEMLVPRTRIHRAAEDDRLSLHSVNALVAADATPDLVVSSFPGLADELGVRQQRTCYSDDIGLASLEDGLSYRGES